MCELMGCLDLEWPWWPLGVHFWSGKQGVVEVSDCEVETPRIDYVVKGIYNAGRPDVWDSLSGKTKSSNKVVFRFFHKQTKSRK